LLAKPVIAQATKRGFDKRITVTAREIRIDSLLKIFSRQTGVEFSFNSKKISASKKIQIPKESKTLSQWLTILEETAGAEHKVIGNRIILLDNNKPNISVKASALKTYKQRTITKKSGALNAIDAAQKQNLVEHRQGVKRDAYNSTLNTDLTKVTQPSSRSTSTINDKKEIPVTKSIDERTNANTRQEPSSTVTPTAPPVRKQADEQKFENWETGSKEMKQHAIQILAGWNRHGSGDMRGIVFGAEYISKDPLFYQPPGSTGYNDASIRSTTAGVQIGVNAGLSFIRTVMNEIKMSAGTFIRYQSESVTDGYSIYPTAVTGVPGPVVQFMNQTRQERFAVGGILQLEYNFTIQQ
jgi:hypothetical protein